MNGARQEPTGPITREFPSSGLWIREAQCRGHDPSLWYPLRGEAAAAKTALAICAACPVAAECMDYALACEEVDPYGGFGIWAGLTGRERNRLRRDLKDAS